MRKHNGWFWVTALLSVFMCSVATAHDLVQPDWRGQDGTTYQEWRFDTNADPAAPEVIVNPYGGASADITIGSYGTPFWIDQLPGYGTQRGYWDIGINDGSIVLDIDNREDPLDHKEIWVQVTYWEDLHKPPTVTVPDAAYLGGEKRLVEQAETGGAWYMDLSKWIIQPNPDHERIIITGHPTGGSMIDQIVVDTICIPEPASLVSVLVGCALLARRRRRP